MHKPPIDSVLTFLWVTLAAWAVFTGLALAGLKPLARLPTIAPAPPVPCVVTNRGLR
jgi:hypothetical protein